MAKSYPKLSQDQKTKIAQFKDSKLTPTQIGKEISIPPLQVLGYLNYLKKDRLFKPDLGKTNPDSGTIPNTQQAPEIKTELKPSPHKPQTQANPEQTTEAKPKEKKVKEEVKEMAIEQSDLEKIQKMINDTTTAVQQKTMELTKQAAQDATTHALTNFKEAEKREKERQDAEARLAQTQVQIDGFCKQFPELCNRVDALEKKVKEPVEPEEPKKEIHSTAREYLECPECSSALIRAMSKMTKSSPDFAKKIQESLKAQGLTLELPKEEEPKHEETKEAEGLF